MENFANLVNDESADKEKIIEELAKLSKKDRMDLIEQVPEMKDTLKDKLGSEFDSIIEAMLTKQITYDADVLHKALTSRFLTEEKEQSENSHTYAHIVKDIICTRKPSELSEIKKEFSTNYGMEISEAIKKVINEIMTDDCKEFLNALLTNQREEEGKVDYQKCKEKARALYSPELKGLPLDKKKIFELVSSENTFNFILLCRLYNRKTKKDFLSLIESTFSEDDLLNQSIRAAIGALCNPSEYYAKKIEEKINAKDPQIAPLIDLLVYREETDIPKIKEYYAFLHGVEMNEALESFGSPSIQNFLTHFLNKGEHPEDEL
ncbi:MAG: annexin [archaeon]|nr:annexin [archaeon]